MREMKRNNDTPEDLKQVKMHQSIPMDCINQGGEKANMRTNQSNTHCATKTKAKTKGKERKKRMKGRVK